ncbi:hypothetical protein PAXRUDRAFT_155720 [Paxillus rubicundulus Ve08.2h10]|uniref:Uncharacterized protein n=1 Tax=Paxillus rubicundulus Ve08.2h10 TaxID=930991 RepID=A0A0D0DBV6_9AGAM|nr:hypothetical protein PAXRUDRAFT_155720 [Paxillus rubicundulus Ve08.2h10]
MVLFSPTHSFSRPTHAFLPVPVCFQPHLLIFSPTHSFQAVFRFSFSVFFPATRFQSLQLIFGATPTFSALPIHFQPFPLVFSCTCSFLPVPTHIQHHSLTWVL